MRLVCCILVTATVTITGCHESKWPKRTTLTPSQAQAINDIAARQSEINDATRGAFRGEVWTVGAIPWNATVMPVASPEGRWIATASGVAPSNASLTAQDGALPPEGSQIEIWELLPGFSGARHQLTLTAPLLLTNAADAEGFLVESPRPDGSRWIGKVDWRTGTIAWLVQDDQVNTTPTLGPQNRLAWSTRSRDQRLFSLAVRLQDGREFAVPSNGSDWLLPSWSPRSMRLAVWRLTPEGVLSLVSMDATDVQSLAAPAHQIPVMTGASRWDAFTATGNLTLVQGLAPPPVEEVVFYHPVHQRMTVWMPTGINSDQLVSLAPDSIDAVHDDRGNFLLTLPRGLHWQSLSDLRNVVRVDHTPVYARPTTDPMRPFMLLDPGRNVVRIRGMRPAAQPADTTTITTGD
ncbi:MAG: hypothetical protein QF561_00490 [Phycisphaerales bacterium]|jgi:hypothetical protein|nr:hypothetical protein [Phycisphaerales bacterium]